MPTTVNGVGTHYYGKKNRAARNAHCRSCQRYGTLESYDTRLWFVVAFIPVIPLGRKRITDACPACSRHFVAAAHQYEQAKQLQTSGSLDRFRREGTPEAALEAHAQLLAFHEYDQAEGIRSAALERFPDDPMLRVALANHLRQHSIYDEMARLHREAHDLDPDLPEARAGVAVGTMAQGLLDESRTLLDFLEEPGAGGEHDLGPLYTLAEKFAGAGRHEEALELYDVLLREAPHLGQRADFRALVRKSERAARAGESALPRRRHSLRGLFVADGSPYSKGQRQAATFGLAVALAAAGLAISNEYIRRHRVIQVVNAGDPVGIQVDDGPVQTVGGLGTIGVGEGRHRIRVTGPIRETHDVAIESGYFERWSSSPAWVLNPGSEAAIMQGTVYYAKQPPEPRQTLLVGRPFFALPHVDYAFVDPPRSMQVKGNNTIVSKEILRWIRMQDAGVFGEIVTTNRAAALDFAERRLRRNPEDQQLFEAYATQTATADHDRADAFLQAGLGHKPLVLPWHRIAQVFANRAERDRMRADYDAALAAEPTNAPLLYLRGRIDDDLDRRTDFYRRSIAADPRLAWPVMASASNALGRQDWGEALALARQAESLQFEDRMTSPVIHAARLALGQADQLVGEYRARLASVPTDIKAVVSLFDALAATGHPEEIEAERAACENRLPADVRGAFGPSLRAIAIYVAADPGAMARFVAQGLPTVEPSIRVHFLLATGGVDAVVADPGLANKIEDAWAALGIALALRLEGKADAAKVWSDKAIAQIEAAPDDDQGVVAILRAPTPTPVEAIRRLIGSPPEKAVLLAFLADRFPERRDEYRREAGRFNIRRAPPYLLVRRAIAGGAAAQP